MKAELITARVEKELKQRAKAAAKVKRRSMAWILSEALLCYLPVAEGDVDPDVWDRYKALAEAKGISLTKLMAPFMAEHINDFERRFGPVPPRKATR